MVGARSFAMAVNRPHRRAGIDGRNPRTAGRGLGNAASGQVAVFAVSLAVFLLAVFNPDPIVRWLWPIPVAMFVKNLVPQASDVSLAMRVGATPGLAPVGGWVAMTGEPLAARLLGAAVAAWVAGFDLFYAISDIEIDRGAQACISCSARSA